MADEGALRSWVSDSLFALLGFAESSLVGFVIALGASLPLAAARVRALRALCAAGHVCGWRGAARTRGVCVC